MVLYCARSCVAALLASTFVPMDTELEPQKRSRWNRSGGRKVDLYRSDIQIFSLLARYRRLPIIYMAALLKREYSSLHARVAKLSMAPNSYIAVPEQILQSRNLSQQFWFELTPKGAAVLTDRGLLTDVDDNWGHHQLVHQAMIDTTFASLEAAIQDDPNAHFRTARDILSSEKFPKEQLAKPHPLSIHVHISYTSPITNRATLSDFDYTNDGIRAIEFANGTKRYIQLEAEHNKPVSRGDISGKSFLRTFLAINYVMQNQLYREKWGIGNLLTLVVVPNQARLDNIKAMIMRETNGVGASYTLLRVVPLMHETLRPMPGLYTAPWERAGYAPFYLNNSQRQ